MSQSCVQEQIKEILGDDNQCYVLMTCKKPSDQGELQVELAYEGDAYLASYLVESAQHFFDEQIQQIDDE